MTTKDDNDNDETGNDNTGTRHITTVEKVNDNNNVIQPKPYSLFFHPYMTWIELIIQLIVPVFFSLNKMVQFSPMDTSTKAIACHNSIRNKMTNMAIPQMKNMIKKWSEFVNCPIAEYVCELPVRINILKDWGILPIDDEKTNEDILNSCSTSPNDKVTIAVRFPSSLLASLPSTTSTNKKNDETTDAGFTKIDELDLSTFSVDTPIVIQFHGGGMTLGGLDDQSILEEFVDLIETDYFLEETSTRSSSKPLISVNVDYSLAPEKPFPSGIIDALSVVEFFITSNPNRKIHISGISAGGNLALVSAFEAHRKYPGRIKSVHSHSPMLCPSTDTMSYYMNSYAARFPSRQWLQWCWQCYLGMDYPLQKQQQDEIASQPNSATITTSASTDKALFLQKGSNAILWEKYCKWNSKNNVSKLVRLIDPSFDIPNSIGSGKTEDKMNIFIVTNKADLLCSEGNDIAYCLKQLNANITLYEDNGVHVFGSNINNEESKTKRLKSWLQSIHYHYQ